MELSDPPPAGRKDESVWTEAFQVRSFEADATGRLGMTHLCNYLQEVAGNHARALGVSVDQLQDLQLTWMLSRLHVAIERYPAWRDTIFIDTWPSGHNGLTASREFQIYAPEGRAIGKATSAWLLIDLKNHRPIRMPEFIDALVVPDRPRAISDNFSRMPSPGRTSTAKSFTVGYNDLDINQHANNVRYIGWALESIPLETMQSRELRQLEVQFRREAKYGEAIASRAELEEGPGEIVALHSLHALNPERELAAVRTRWTRAI